MKTQTTPRKQDEQRAIIAVAIFILFLLSGVFYNAIVNGMQL